MSNYALINESGVVDNIVVWDGVGDLFPDFTAVIFDGADVSIGWSYDGSSFVAPKPIPKTHDELVFFAEEEKKSRMDFTNNFINAQQWPSKLQLNRLSDDDKLRFNLWLDYLDEVSAIDTSTAPHIDWPDKPE